MAILGCRHQPLFGEAALHKEDAVAEVAKAIHPVWNLLVSQEVKDNAERENKAGLMTMEPLWREYPAPELDFT